MTPKSKLSSDGNPGEPEAEAMFPDPFTDTDEPSESPERRANPPPLPPSARSHHPGLSGSKSSDNTAEPTHSNALPAAAAVPSIRPAPPPEAALFHGQGVALEPDDVERASTGFSALFEHTSLREWIRRIESAQCDAVVTVNGELGHGQLWCVAGNVFDATWHGIDTERGLTGEDAAYQILTLRRGDVSVEFVPVDRPRVIELSTRQLLGKVSRRANRPSLIMQASEVEALAARPSDAAAAQRTTLFYRPTTTGVFPNLATQLTAIPPEPKPRLATYLAGAVALMTLAAVAFGIRQLASNPSADGNGVEQVRVGALQAAALPTVQIEVVPATAAIWLDSKRLGTGRVSQGAIRDGLVHQLRFIAPGYAPRSIFFRDLPAAGKVVLEPMASSEQSLKRAAATLDPVLNPAPSEPVAPTNAPRHSVGLTSTQNPVVSNSRQADRADARTSAARGPDPKPAVASVPRPAPPPSNPPPPPPKPQIQVIEERTPRVQIID
jgi:hypothetical protein